MPEAIDIYLNVSEQQKIKAITRYREEQHGYVYSTGNHAHGHPISKLNRPSSVTNLIPLFEAMKEDGILIKMYTKPDSRVDLLDKLLDPPFLTTEQFYDQMSDLIPLDPEPGGVRTLKLAVINIGDNYKWNDHRQVFSHLAGFDKTFKMAATSLVVNTKHAVCLFVDKERDTAYVIHNSAQAEEKGLYLEVWRRFIALIPHLFDYKPSFGIDPFIGLVDKHKARIQPVIDWYIDKYYAEVQAWERDAKFRGLLEVKTFNVTRLEQQNRHDMKNIESWESEIANCYRKIAERQAKIMHADGANEHMQELVDYIIKYKANSIMDIAKVSDTAFEIEFIADHMYYDDRLFDILKNKRASKLHHDQPLGQLLQGIRDSKFDVRWTGRLHIDIQANEVKAADLQQFHPDYLINPHLHEFSCLGTNAGQIRKAIEAGNYIGMFEQLLGTVGSINLSDGTITVRAFNAMENARNNSIWDGINNEWVNFKTWKDRHYKDPHAKKAMEAFEPEPIPTRIEEEDTLPF